MARPAESEFTWMDVNSAIEDTLALVRYDGRASAINIISVSESSLPTVWLRRQNLEQVLLNVLLNALDAMAVEPAQEEHSLEIARGIRDGMIEIRISDTGTGMNDEVWQRAFEPFFTTKESGKGTGLGLYVSRQLMEEIGGAISAADNTGPGATVTIRLPISPADDVVGTGRFTLGEQGRENITLP